MSVYKGERKRLTIRVSKRAVDLLNRVAAVNKKSINDMIEIAIWMLLEQEALDAAAQEKTGGRKRAKGDLYDQPEGN